MAGNREQRRAAEKRARSEAGLKQAYNEGHASGFNTGVDKGVRLAMGIALMALLDKGHIQKEDVIPTWMDICYEADSVKKGYISADEIYETLHKDYDINI